MRYLQQEQMPLGGQIHRIRLKNLKGKLYILFIFRRDREDDSYPYSMQFGPFAYKDTTLRENATHLDSLNADFGLDASGRPGLYMAFTPQIYWRPASGYDREFYDKGNQGTLDNQTSPSGSPRSPRAPLPRDTMPKGAPGQSRFQPRHCPTPLGLSAGGPLQIQSVPADPEGSHPMEPSL
ncbi:MAG: hypothetical protein U0176_03070 [Bacteroidia bacterium]